MIAAMQTACTIAVLLLLGCPPSPKPEPGPKPPPKTGCAAACANVRAIGGCDGWQDVDGGESCEQMCAGVQADGEVVLDTACVAKATTCLGVNDC